MNNEIQIFKNQEFGEIRTIEKDGEPWFVARDVAEILGYVNLKDAIIRHCRWVVKHDLPHPQSPGKMINVSIIPERDVYRLIMRSKLPEAEKFEDWVVGEVLPTIRKTGGYVADATGFVNNYFPDIPDNAKSIMIQTLDSRKRLLMERDKLLLIQKKLLPKAEFYDAVAGSKDAVAMEIVAKVLNYGIGRNTLFRFLRDYNILRYNNIPYQQYVDAGYFRVIEQKWNKPNGEAHISFKTIVFQKGISYIRKLLDKNLTIWKKGVEDGNESKIDR